MHVSKQKKITKLVAQAKEFDSYITKYGQKSRICSVEQVDLVKIFLQSYKAFLPDMSPNSCGYFGPEEWAVDKHKARESVRVWWKETHHFVAHEIQQSYYDNHDPEEPPLRFKHLLETYPNDKVLQRVIAPLFLHHSKAFCVVWFIVWFVMTSWCALSFGRMCRVAVIVVFPVLAFGPMLMAGYMLHLETKIKCD